MNVKLLDGEDLRNKLNRVYGYSAEERFNAIKQYIKIVENENKKGNIVIISTVSHKIEMREFARDKLINFFEVILVCSSETCAIRDYKNIYNRIDENSNECLPGVTEPYEISKNAELILDTEKTSIAKSKLILLKYSLEFIKNIDSSKNPLLSSKEF